MPARSIPPEILDSIIELYAEDQKILCSCSLVAKSWLQSSRYRLFGDLTLHLGGLHEAKFLALLEHPLCTFSTSVRKLWILPMQGTDLSNRVNNTITQLGKLTAVRTLRIHRQKIIPLQTLSALATAFKDITTLVMMIRFAVLSDAIRFMCAFPLLEEVHFEPIRTPPGDFPSADIRMPPRLRSLHIDTLRSHERWFADNRVGTLTTLSLVNIRPLDDVSRLDEMLEIFNASIRHLTLGFSTQSGDFAVQVNLSHNTELRYVEIDLTQLTRRHVLPAITSLRSPHLETIVWRNRRAFNFSAEFWTRLDDLLSDRDMLPVLNKFLIMASKPSKTIFNPRLHMPQCDALGILGGDEDIITGFD
ncbi:RING-type domain-containing protein [Mycena sanguinolenta]|uniref:RING-type domain-containing protein n=1 Tax=Mycena sanguinolenta TaxID=230812 RepID=A0A8H6ZFP9_9AGAR|nr:RING-type domain-containing protein [Mycena sanguinolenta]